MPGKTLKNYPLLEYCFKYFYENDYYDIDAVDYCYNLLLNDMRNSAFSEEEIKVHLNSFVNSISLALSQFKEVGRYK